MADRIACGCVLIAAGSGGSGGGVVRDRDMRTGRLDWARIEFCFVNDGWVRFG